MEYIIHVANILFLLSYLVRDIMWLRLITILAICLLMPYYYYQPEPLIAAIVWNLLFVGINVVQIYILWLERRPVYLSEKEQQIQSMAFPNMAPRDFKRLASAGKWKQYANQTQLIEKGQNAERMLVLSKGNARVVSQDQHIATLGPGQFVGEMSYFTGSETSATVTSENDIEVLEWSFDSLKKIVAKYPSLLADIQLNIGNDLCKKLNPNIG